jgi:hypothetical protein
MNALDVINSLKDAKPTTVTLPAVRGIHAKAELMVHGQKYAFPSYQQIDPGWYDIKLSPPNKAEIMNKACEAAIHEMLQSYPEMRMIVMHKTMNGTYMVFPSSIDVAELRGFYIEPMEVYLTDRELEPFSIILVRKIGEDLVYDTFISEPERRIAEAYKNNAEELNVPGTSKEMKIAYSLLLDNVGEHIPHDPRRDDEDEDSDYDRDE